MWNTFLQNLTNLEDRNQAHEAPRAEFSEVVQNYASWNNSVEAKLSVVSWIEEQIDQEESGTGHTIAGLERLAGQQLNLERSSNWTPQMTACLTTTQWIHIESVIPVEVQRITESLPTTPFERNHVAQEGLPEWQWLERTRELYFHLLKYVQGTFHESAHRIPEVFVPRWYDPSQELPHQDHTGVPVWVRFRQVLWLQQVLSHWPAWARPSNSITDWLVLLMGT